MSLLFRYCGSPIYPEWGIRGNRGVWAENELWYYDCSLWDRVPQHDIYASSCRGAAEWITMSMRFLLTCIFLALGAGFPWQPQAQSPCPRATQCIPDGVLTVTFSISGDTVGCVFNATVHWGDGVIDHVSHIVDGQKMTHTYDAPGTYGPRQIRDADQP